MSFLKLHGKGVVDVLGTLENFVGGFLRRLNVTQKASEYAKCLMSFQNSRRLLNS